MLATQRIMSYPGQQNNFPFGCMWNSNRTRLEETDDNPPDNQDSIHGVGLPDFMIPAPPPGQPLLNDNETHDLSSFFTDFESNDYHAKSVSRSQFQDNGQMTLGYDLPPTFVRSETSYGGVRSGVDPHQLQMGGYNMYNTAMVPSNIPHINAENNFEHGLHHPGNGMLEPSYPNPLLNQLHTAPSAIPQPYGPSWQPSFPTQNLIPQMIPNGRPMVRFGSDSHFQTTHYAAPNGQMEPEMMQNLDWIEAQSSATNTQPNTQPSSPYVSKKRKFDDYLPASGFPMNVTNGHSIGLPSAHTTPPNLKVALKGRKSVKQEQPPTPISATKHVFQDPIDHGEDDDEPSPGRSPSPAASWSKTKVKPPRSTKSLPPSKPKRTSKKTARTPKLERTASISARTPLTAEQKKANHTNSEQRRRDATARAYAELYDLVPELEALGKQSTMKKLEVVVNALKRLKEGNATLREMLS